jgi:hypothetical protein
MKKGIVDLKKVNYSRTMTFYYQELNKKFYGGKLPNIEVYFGPLPCRAGAFKYGVTGIEKIKGKPTAVHYIVLNKKVLALGSDVSEMVLIHESIHARYPDLTDHDSPEFKKIVRRLVRAGALDDIL